MTNTSVNPAQHRCGRVRWRVGAGATWLFWVAPIVGGLLNAVVYRFISDNE
ncbi:MAG: hypothetical protein R2851_23820 [Caldilineaceae bacterium]